MLSGIGFGQGRELDLPQLRDLVERLLQILFAHGAEVHQLQSLAVDETLDADQRHAVPSELRPILS